jgi:hypothetical protein
MGDWSKIEDPTTQEKRDQVAGRCRDDLGFDFTTVVDTIDDATAVRWAAWPERLFVIDREGKIAYAGGMGPFGFWPTERYREKARGRRGFSLDFGVPGLDTFLEEFLASR